MSASPSPALFLTSVLVPMPTAAAPRIPAEVRAQISALHRTVAAELVREALFVGTEPEAELTPELASPWTTAL